MNFRSLNSIWIEFELIQKIKEKVHYCIGPPLQGIAGPDDLSAHGHENPAKQCWGGGEGVVEERAHAMGVRIWGLGGKDTHQGGLAAARDSMAGKMSMTTSTNGHRSWTPGQGGPVYYGGACGTLGWARGGNSCTGLAGEEALA
jgi:hypothetical protein